MTLDDVLDFLDETSSRATYKAVGEVVGIHERRLRDERAFRDRDPRTAWVVLAKTGQPPPEIHEPRPPSSRIIEDRDELRRCVRKWRDTGA